MLSNKDSLILVMTVEEAALLREQTGKAICEMAKGERYTQKDMPHLLELLGKLRDFLREGDN